MRRAGILLMGTREEDKPERPWDPVGCLGGAAAFGGRGAFGPPAAKPKAGAKAPAFGCRKSGLRHFFEVFIAPLRLRRGQGAMQGNPCYARLFADLPYMPPNPIKA